GGAFEVAGKELSRLRVIVDDENAHIGGAVYRGDGAARVAILNGTLTRPCGLTAAASAAAPSGQEERNHGGVTIRSDPVGSRAELNLADPSIFQRRGRSEGPRGRTRLELGFCSGGLTAQAGAHSPRRSGTSARSLSRWRGMSCWGLETTRRLLTDAERVLGGTYAPPGHDRSRSTGQPPAADQTEPERLRPPRCIGRCHRVGRCAAFR